VIIINIAACAPASTAVEKTALTLACFDPYISLQTTQGAAIGALTLLLSTVLKGTVEEVPALSTVGGALNFFTVLLLVIRAVTFRPDSRYLTFPDSV
jgi:hypothetical protein